MAQQVAGGTGLKCPTTRVASGCNLKGQCDDYFPVGSEYVVQFDYMITKYTDGFNHCFFNILGPNVALCYTDGAYWIMNVNANDQTNGVKLSILASPVTLFDDMNTWITWTINYFQDANGSGYFNVAKNGVQVGGANLSMNPGTARRVELGVYSIMPMCATADYQFYMRNIVIYKGTSVPATYTGKRRGLFSPLFPLDSPLQSFLPCIPSHTRCFGCLYLCQPHQVRSV